MLCLVLFCLFIFSLPLQIGFVSNFAYFFVVVLLLLFDLFCFLFYFTFIILFWNSLRFFNSNTVLLLLLLFDVKQTHTCTSSLMPANVYMYTQKSNVRAVSKWIKWKLANRSKCCVCIYIILMNVCLCSLINYIRCISFVFNTKMFESLSSPCTAQYTHYVFQSLTIINLLVRCIRLFRACF